jgi:hypothetical protein
VVPTLASESVLCGRRRRWRWRSAGLRGLVNWIGIRPRCHQECRHHGRYLLSLFAHMMQVLAAGRAVRRSAEIRPPQRSHTRYSPVTTRSAARSRSSRSTRACLSMACTWARSNATVAPSGSCSSSSVLSADASTMPSHWRINESISRTVRARSSLINSFAARRCAGESPAGSVGSSTTSPTKRASYPFQQPQQRVEPVCKARVGRAVREGATWGIRVGWSPYQAVTAAAWSWLQPAAHHAWYASHPLQRRNRYGMTCRCLSASPFERRCSGRTRPTGNSPVPSRAAINGYGHHWLRLHHTPWV